MKSPNSKDEQNSVLANTQLRKCTVREIIAFVGMKFQSTQLLFCFKWNFGCISRANTIWFTGNAKCSG